MGRWPMGKWPAPAWAGLFFWPYCPFGNVLEEREALSARPVDHKEKDTFSWGGWEGKKSKLGENSFWHDCQDAVPAKLSFRDFAERPIEAMKTERIDF